jgi:transposase
MESPHVVGIDTSKANLSVWIWGGAGVLDVPNRAQDILPWARSLPPGSRIGIESTGRFHKAVAEICHALGHIVYVLQPRDMSHYRRTVSPRGKTDAIDAEVLARYVAREHESLRPWSPPTRQQELLDTLLKGRAFCSRTRASVQQLADSIPELKALLADIVTSLDRAVKSVDRSISETVSKTPEVAAGCRRMETIEGVGPVTAAALGNVMDRNRFRDQDALVGYLGLDPRPMESGKFRGRRRLSKRGPAEIRRLLFLAAMSGIRKPAWKSVYQRYLARGLPRIGALCVVARKIVRVAWKLWNDAKATFEPARVEILPKAA